VKFEKRIKASKIFLIIFCNKLRMAKKKKALARNKSQIVGQKKGLSDAYTGTDLRELLSQGQVVIGLNTFYKLYKENVDLRAGIRKIANKVAVN